MAPPMAPPIPDLPPRQVPVLRPDPGQNQPLVFNPDRLEQGLIWLRENWAYAVAALSLALAGVFFVQYGIEKGLLPPPMRVLAGLGFVAVFAGAANTPLASTIIAMELFGSEVGIYAALACVASYYFSGHSGIYRSQRIAHGKHRPFPRGLRLSELAAWRRRQE